MTKPHTLVLDRAQLRRLHQAFSREIGAGLARDGATIKALRTYLAPPLSSTERSCRPASADAELDGAAAAPPTQPRPAEISHQLPAAAESGEESGLAQHVAVVDVGGTNCRAAMLCRTSGQLELTETPLTTTLPFRGDEPLEAATFFDLQAELLAKIGPQPNLPLGYCFSYPAEITPDGDARLIGWTKGIAVRDVEGQTVGRLLTDALTRRRIPPSRVAVLNDTVASLLAASSVFEAPARMTAGLIAGTGTNMAGFFDHQQATKLSVGEGTMALNLESGNLRPPDELLTPADHAVDRRERPGKQRFEKAVGGYYLPYVFAEMNPRLRDFHPELGSGPLAQLISDGSRTPDERAQARALFDRSADLVAAGLAALLDHYPAGSVGILAEGSLFWRTPGYAERVEQRLTELVGADRFALLRREHANLIGAATAALSPSLALSSDPSCVTTVAD